MKDRFTQPELSAIRAKLANRKGAALWRSLDELSDNPDFRQAIEREFPDAASEWDDNFSRRNFLKLMAASLALAGLSTGCSDKAQEDIVPYVNQPESMVPGKPIIFATAMPFDGYGKGVLVSTREGRPIKIEGNPDHPATLGGSDVFMQASILTLYDPDRSQNVTRAGSASSWNAFFDELNPRLAAKRNNGGAGMRILTAPTTSPTFAANMREFRQRFPQAKWHQFSPTARVNTIAGAQTAFGRRANPIYRFDLANVVLSLDSDFLIDDPASLRYARNFIAGRRVRKEKLQMNRLYVIESTLTITGSTADHRIGMKPSRIEMAANAIRGRVMYEKPLSPPDIDQKWMDVLTDDLRANAGSCIVIAGETQPPAVHAMAHLMNQVLGNVGKTVYYIDALEVDPVDPVESLRSLVADMDSGAADLLLILGDNPAYTSPADVPFADALEKFSAQQIDGEYKNLTAHLGLYEDETSFRSQWHLPQAHYLEAWGDVRAFDGTTSIIQPLISPLYNGRSIDEFLQPLLGRPDRGGYEVIREFWRTQHNSPPDFEQWWQTSLKQGVIANSASPPIQVTARATAFAIATGPSALELVIRTDPSIHDGSFATNAWLQELPRPFTKLVWDNAALIGPKTAEKTGLHEEQVITITSQGRSISAPVLILPGVPENVVTIHLGYGRSRAAQMSRIGFDAYKIRTSNSPWFASAEISATPQNLHLVTTRSHHAMDGSAGTLAAHAIVNPNVPQDERELNNRRLVRVVTLQQYKTNPQIVKDLGGEIEKKPLLSLFKEWDYSQGYQWAMSIDMTSCIGCNACVVACQAENNISVVGKDQVDRQREMHWIRIDDYFGGDLDNPEVHHQPVPCMHCENAPCEYVCPVGATTHSAEGINQMTYNRCVGTRYCSNNCPYKVRRFNFLSYADNETTPQKKLQRNPDVTVRTNGVMEKCSYCIQRIQGTRIEIEKMLVDLKERARLAGDESQRQQLLAQSRQQELQMLESLETACVQSCPTQAIVFGDINHPQTKISKIKQEPTDYSLLTELTTKPRTTYLARVTNPNPALEGGG